MGLLAQTPPLARRRRRDLPGRRVLLALALALTGCGAGSDAVKPLRASGEWVEFTGSWNAAGTRQTIPLGADRRASVLRLSGSLLLEGADRPGVGFRSEVVAHVDSATGLVGSGVWTDERGDQAFSRLEGEGTATDNRLKGTFLGGTGRFVGLTGTYEFSWKHVIESEDGSVQGRAVGLKGRVRIDPAAGGPR
jgi:hypothetical protein